MFTANIQYPWHVMSPVAFRFMEKRWIDEFFNHAKIRLSSFKRFAEHPDEKRLDVAEGEVGVLLQPREGPGHALYAALAVGKSAYALSTTLRNDEASMDEFGSRDYIKINNSTAFGMAIARQIPRLRRGIEGPCRYLANKVVYKPVTGISMEQFTDPATGSISLSRIDHYLQEHVQTYPYFLKHLDYVPEAEYRFIWEYEGAGDDYIDLLVPEALQYCEPPSEFHR